jgi:hypothetical protein
VVKRLIRSQVKDGPPSHARTLRVYGDGPFRPFQGASRREEVLLAKFRGGRSLLLGETRKMVQGVDSMCPCCGEEEEDLEHVLRACPDLESPRRRNFVQVPRRSWLCRQIRWRWHRSSGRSSSGTLRDCLPPTHTHTAEELPLGNQEDSNRENDWKDAKSEINNFLWVKIKNRFADAG